MPREENEVYRNVINIGLRVAQERGFWDGARWEAAQEATRRAAAMPTLEAALDALYEHSAG